MTMTFAALIQAGFSPPALGSGASQPELMILFGVLTGLSIVLLVAAAYMQKGPLRRFQRRRRHRHHHHRSGKQDSQGQGVAPSEVPPAKRWRRRRRRDHRPRNPTLAETGGLPPARSENVPERPA